MELGTQDIFLEKKKRVQQDATTGVFDIAAQLAKGLTKDQKRTAIINVSKKTEEPSPPATPKTLKLVALDKGGATGDGQASASSQSPKAKESDETIMENLDDLIGLPELRHIVCKFINFFEPIPEPPELSFGRRMSRLHMKFDELGDGTDVKTPNELRVRQIRMAALNAMTSTYKNPLNKRDNVSQQDIQQMMTLPPIHPSMKLRLNQQQFIQAMRHAFREKLNESHQNIAMNAFTPVAVGKAQAAVNASNAAVSAAENLAANLRDEDFAFLFQSIDHEKTGTVDWDDFTSYLMSQRRDKSKVGKSASEYATTAQPPSCPVWHQHDGVVTCMLIHPRTGMVLTGGEDGAVHGWDGVTMRHLRLFTQCKSWVADMKFTNNEQKILVVCLDRQLLILDARNGDVLRLYRGRHLVETDMGVNYAHETIPTISIGERVPNYLLPKGAKVGANRSEDARKSALMAQQATMSFSEFQKMLADEKKNRTEKRKLEEFALAGMTDTPSCMEYHCSALGEEFIMFGMTNGTVRFYVIPVSHLRIVRKHFVMQLHTERVRKLQVIPFLDGVMSCSDDGTILLTSLETGLLLKSYTKHGHHSGVTSFCFSHHYKLMVSCAADRNGLVWDYLQESPIARLEQHTCPVLGCAINDADGHIITVGVDNSVMIFDVRSCQLLQSFHERTSLFSCVAFDTNKLRLVCTTSFPSMYQLKKMISTFPQDYFGHTSPVAFTAYNAAFDQLLTIDMESLAMTWKPELGENVFTFRLAAFSSLLDDVRLTTMIFDRSQRRLITGFHNGVTGVWNYVNGQAQNLIRSTKVDECTNREVTALATLERSDTTFFFTAVGRLLVYQEQSQQYTITESPTWSLDESLGIITAMRQVGTSLIACGTSSGAVVIFSILTESQDGCVLWPEASNDDSNENSSSGHSAFAGPSGGLSRVTHLFALSEKPYQRLFFAMHSDGRVVLWHTFRRLFLCAEFIGPRSSSVSITHVLHTESHNLFTVADELGNITLWEYELAEVSEHDIGAFPRLEIELSVDATPFRIESMSVLHRFYAQTTSVVALEVVPQKDDDLFIVVSTPNNVTRIFNRHGACMGDFGFAKWRSLYGPPKTAAMSPATIDLDHAETSGSQEGPLEGLGLAPPGGSSVRSPQTPNSHLPLGTSAKRKLKKLTNTVVSTLIPVLMLSPASPKSQNIHSKGEMDKPPVFSLFSSGQRLSVVSASGHASARASPTYPQSPTFLPSVPEVSPREHSLSITSMTPLRPATVEGAARGKHPSQPPRDGSSTAAGGPRRPVRIGGPKMRDGIVKHETTIHGLQGGGGSVDVENTSLCMDMSGGGGLRHVGSMLGPHSVGALSIGSSQPSGGSPRTSMQFPLPANSAGATSAGLAIPRVPQVIGEQEKAALLANHLQLQLGRLKGCKTNLTEELKRVEQRIQAMHRHDASLNSAREDEDIIAQLPWTSRVSSRLMVTKIDEIRPPEGSRAYEEDNRRNARLRAAAAGEGGTNRSTAGDVRADMFPSVTAPNAS